MANLLNMSSIMMCPHGGTVSAITANTQVMAAGDLCVLATDTYVVAGCPFVVGVVPHPCVQVEWVQPDSASQINGSFSLSEESVGLCIAADMSVQGTVLIVMTQLSVSGM